MTKDKQGIDQAYDNLEATFNLIGDHQRSLSLHNKVLKIYKRIKDFEGIAHCYKNIGQVQYNMGKFDRSIYYYELGKDIYDKLGEQTGVAECCMNIGISLTSKLEYDRSLDYLFKALDIHIKLERKKDIAVCLINLGRCYSSMEDHKKAYDVFKRALTLCEELDLRSGLSICYSNMGLIFDTYQQYEKAIEYQNKALEIDIELEDREGILAALLNIGHSYTWLGDYEKALEYFDGSISGLKEGSRPDISLEAYSGKGIAQFFMKRYQDAKISLLNAIKYHEEIRRDLFQVSNRAKYIDRYEGLFKALIDSSIHTKDPQTAFKAIEISRGLSQSELIEYGLSINNKAIPKELETRYNQLRHSLTEVRKRIHSFHDDKDRYTFSESRIKMKNTINTFNRYMEITIKEYKRLQEELKEIEKEMHRYDHQFAPSQWIPELKEIQTKLKEGEYLINWYLPVQKRSEDKDGYAIIIDKNGIDALRIKYNEMDLKRTNDLYDVYLSYPSNAKTSEDMINEDLEHIFSVFIEPVMDKLDSSSDGDQRILYMNLDGPLSKIPIHAMKIRNGEEWILLLEKVDIRYILNVTTWYNSRSDQDKKKDRKEIETVNIFAVTKSIQGPLDIRPTFDIGRYRTVDLYTDLTKNQFSKVLRSYGGEYPFRNVKSLSKKKIKKVLSSEQLFYLFYTHGSYDVDSPYMSALELGGGDLIKAHEILSLKKRDEPLDVLLIACESGLHGEKDQQDIPTLHRFGFIQSFIHLGARGLVGAQWKVPVEGMKNLLPLILKYYFDKSQESFFNLSEALRRAQIEYAKQEKNPWYWAGLASYQVI
jgi:tetratricopeptide (TPR) repeat protein